MQDKGLAQFSDFTNLDIRVGQIKDAEPLANARSPAYVMHIDFGKDLGIKKTSAQITEHYSTDELIEKQVVAVVNFAPKQIGNIVSECLVLGVYASDGVVLLGTDKSCENGQRIG